jgi:hypothetical protein
MIMSDGDKNFKTIRLQVHEGSISVSTEHGCDSIDEAKKYLSKKSRACPSFLA